jgi:plasmid stability protein
VAAFHLRNIPPKLYERLRVRAAADGRSINGEILAILERDLSQPSADELNRRLDELRAKWAHRELVPPPEDLIREDRDSR